MERKLRYHFVGGLKGTRVCAWIFLVLDLGVSTLKFVSDAQVVLGYPYPAWGLVPVGDSMVVGQVVDVFWMLFNALLPLIISRVRSKTDQPLEITIDMKPPLFVLKKLREEEEA